MTEPRGPWASRAAGESAADVQPKVTAEGLGRNSDQDPGESPGQKPGKDPGREAIRQPIPDAVAREAPAAAAGSDGQGAEPVPAAALPSLALQPASISRELVTLRPEAAGMVAPYKQLADKVLAKPWRRTSLFFTSPRANAGATATAVNVATLLSRSAESALLVELQVTGGSLWSMLGLPPVAHGLEDALRGQVSFESCLSRIAGEKLDVLLIKQPMSVEEAGHLSGALNDFLEWAEERFPWLIVDCPPVLEASWTRWFDLNADPVVLVAGLDRTKRHELRKVAQRLGDRLAGTILNAGPQEHIAG